MANFECLTDGANDVDRFVLQNASDGMQRLESDSELTFLYALKTLQRNVFDVLSRAMKLKIFKS